MKALNETEISLIKLLGTRGPSTREDIAKALNASMNTVYHALSRLVAWGYVSVVKPQAQGGGRPKLMYAPAKPISDIARTYLEGLGAGDLLLAIEVLGNQSTVDVRGLPKEYGLRVVSERLNYQGSFLVLGNDLGTVGAIMDLCSTKGVRVSPSRQITGNLLGLIVG